MTDQTETLLRDTLQRQADRAPTAAALLTRLDARQRRRAVPRKALLVGATAAVVVGLAIGAVQFAGPGGSSEQAPPAAQPQAHGVLMKWEPHWLPTGMTEKTRSLARNGTMRLWTDTPVDQTGNTKGPVVSVDEMRDAKAKPTSPSAKNSVDINGTTGSLIWIPDAKDALVSWVPEPGVVVSARVTGLDHAKDVVLRVARSMRPDGTARFSSIITVADLPENWGSGAVIRMFGNTPRDAQTEVTMSRDIPGDFNGGMTLYAFTLVKGKPLPTPVDGSTEPPVYVDPAPGVRVVLLGDLLPSHNPKIDNKADTERIGKLIHVDPDVDVSWIGTP